MHAYKHCHKGVTSSRWQQSSAEPGVNEQGLLLTSHYRTSLCVLTTCDACMPAPPEPPGHACFAQFGANAALVALGTTRGVRGQNLCLGAKQAYGPCEAARRLGIFVEPVSSVANFLKLIKLKSRIIQPRFFHILSKTHISYPQPNNQNG